MHEDCGVAYNYLMCDHLVKIDITILGVLLSLCL